MYRFIRKTLRALISGSAGRSAARNPLDQYSGRGPPGRSPGLLEVRSSECGNVFFTLFGAIALVGVIGVATSTLMRGPVGTVMALNLRARIDSQLQIARKLIALNAVNQAASGDCDSDGVVEPEAPDASCAQHPAGGGCIPTDIGAAKTDPWGTTVGYCAWNHGTGTSPPGTCSAGLLAGASANYQGKTVIAVISAGPDRQFQSTCGDDPAYVTKGGDDIVEQWTMDEAQALAGGGLWTLVSGSPDQIAPVKDIGNATFASGTTASFQGTADFGAGSKLNLASGALFNLPTQAQLPDASCQGAQATANDGVLRVNTAAGRVLQICDPTALPSATWVNIGGSTSVTKIDDLIDAVSDFTTGANLFLGNGGGISISGATKNVAVGIGAGAGVTSGTGNVLLGWQAGKTIATGSHNILIGDTVDTTAGKSNFIDIGGLIYGDSGKVGIGVPSPGYTLDVGGGTLNAGTTTLGSTTMGAATVNGALSVVGASNATSLGGDLTVTGASTLNGGTQVNNTLTVGSFLTTLGGPLTVTGVSTLNGVTTVNNTFTATGSATLENGVAVTGNATATGDIAGASFQLGTVISGVGLFTDGSNGLQLETNALRRLQITSGGAVGIGVGTPATQLDVGGAIKVGEDITACGATMYGAIRYDSSTDKIQACSSTNAWVTVGTSGGGGGGGGGFWLAGSVPGSIYYSSAVGIGGVTGPVAPLEMNGEFLDTGGYTGTAFTPVTGAGTRMFFDPASSAFRAGSVTGTAWDSGNVGNYSAAFGLDTKASGTGSTALGSYVMAGTNSLAIGLSGIGTATIPSVTGIGSFGIFMQDQSNKLLAANNTMGLFGGRFVIDPNPAATALLSAPLGGTALDVNGNVGSVRYCDVNGLNCFTASDVTGGSTGAPGNDREVIFNSGGKLGTYGNFVFTSAGSLGIGTASPGEMLFVSGGNLVATGTFGSGSAIAESGAGTRMMWYPKKAAFRAGYIDGTQWDDASIGTNSAAFGAFTTASGGGSTALGWGTNASGIYSTAFGFNTTAYGWGSAAFGGDTTASGQISTASGFHTTAAGTTSAALGSYVYAGDTADTNGMYSMAIGLNNTNTANYADLTGNGSLMIAMRDQHNVVMTANNAMALLGGSMIINPGTGGGVGTVSTPDTALDVRGEIKIGNTGLACSGTTEGAQRYTSTSHNMEFCNGTSWIAIPQTCSGTTPTVFTFTNQANQATSTLITSNIIQVSGMGCAVSTTISGNGSPAYRICSDNACATVVQDWTTGASLMTSGQYLQLRLTTASAGGVTNSATVTVGNGATVWGVSTTGSCASSPAVGTVCADGSVYAGLSPDGSVPMYATRCDAGQTWNGVTCSGVRFSLTWNNGTTNWIDEGYENVTAGRANTTGLAALADAASPHYAAQQCKNLNEDGHTDWYLPSLNEISVLYSGNSAIGNFDTSGTWYWPSTENGSNLAWFQIFSNGYQGGLNKNYALAVRCVRR